MHLKIITQRQIIPIYITTANKPIKTFHKVLLLPLSLLFIIVSLIMLVHSSISLPIYFYKYNFYGLNIALVYTCRIDIRKYLDSTCTLYHNPPHQ